MKNFTVIKRLVPSHTILNIINCSSSFVLHTASFLYRSILVITLFVDNYLIMGSPAGVGQYCEILAASGMCTPHVTSGRPLSSRDKLLIGKLSNSWVELLLLVYSVQKRKPLLSCSLKHSYCLMKPFGIPIRQWRIYIQNFPARPPTGPNSFVFTYVFTEKCLCRRLVPPPMRVCTPPPNGKSWIRP